LARIRAVLRRAVPSAQPALSHRLQQGAIVLDAASREVTADGTVIPLTSAEFNVLMLLMQQVGKVVSKSELTEKVLHRKLTAYDRAIDVHVSRVRQKLSQHTGDKNLIKTVRGEGYQLVQSV